MQTDGKSGFRRAPDHDPRGLPEEPTLEADSPQQPGAPMFRGALGTAADPATAYSAGGGFRSNFGPGNYVAPMASDPYHQQAGSAFVGAPSAVTPYSVDQDLPLDAPAGAPADAQRSPIDLALGSAILQQNENESFESLLEQKDNNIHVRISEHKKLFTSATQSSIKDLCDIILGNDPEDYIKTPPNSRENSLANESEPKSNLTRIFEIQKQNNDAKVELLGEIKSKRQVDTKGGNNKYSFCSCCCSAPISPSLQDQVELDGLDLVDQLLRLAAKVERFRRGLEEQDQELSYYDFIGIRKALDYYNFKEPVLCRRTESYAASLSNAEGKYKEDVQGGFKRAAHAIRKIDTGLSELTIVSNMKISQADAEEKASCRERWDVCAQAMCLRGWDAAMENASVAAGNPPRHDCIDNHRCCLCCVVSAAVCGETVSCCHKGVSSVSAKCSGCCVVPEYQSMERGCEASYQQECSWILSLCSRERSDLNNPLVSEQDDSQSRSCPNWIPWPSLSWPSMPSMPSGIFAGNSQQPTDQEMRERHQAGVSNDEQQFNQVGGAASL